MGIQRIDATRAATVATLEPVVSAALAYAFWGEALGALGYAGAALVLAGVLTATAGPRARVTGRPGATRPPR